MFRRDHYFVISIISILVMLYVTIGARHSSPIVTILGLGIFGAIGLITIPFYVFTSSGNIMRMIVGIGNGIEKELNQRVIESAIREAIWRSSMLVGAFTLTFGLALGFYFSR